ncbi:uncharacterized protein C10orf95-like [Eublepharis macularius]|uniref:Uncharacterized protein C10orf95-like n=1 Tax=Eublepharis macularius TaxID=481883 RepID=A0AA97KM15_EUBMA|nr:uncharacterized protein C10orf95-like [Eublepharis macularius]
MAPRKGQRGAGEGGPRRGGRRPLAEGPSEGAGRAGGRPRCRSPAKSPGDGPLRGPLPGRDPGERPRRSWERRTEAPVSRRLKGAERVRPARGQPCAQQPLRGSAFLGPPSRPVPAAFPPGASLGAAARGGSLASGRCGASSAHRPRQPRRSPSRPAGPAKRAPLGPLEGFLCRPGCAEGLPGRQRRALAFPGSRPRRPGSASCRPLRWPAASGQVRRPQGAARLPCSRRALRAREAAEGSLPASRRFALSSPAETRLAVPPSVWVFAPQTVFVLRTCDTCATCHPRTSFWFTCSLDTWATCCHSGGGSGVMKTKQSETEALWHLNN